jgi:hypothetical protein
VDESVLRKQHAMVSKSFKEDVKNIPGVRIEVVSTLGRGKPTPIATKPENGQMQVHQPSKYREMLAKGDVVV